MTKIFLGGAPLSEGFPVLLVRQMEFTMKSQEKVCRRDKKWMGTKIIPYHRKLKHAASVFFLFCFDFLSLYNNI